MGLPIVAEGVESKEQLDAMIDLGIAYIQGFYFSRPVPRDEFLAFLSERNGVQEELQLAHGAA
jgi:EAL domain-containing protein (putative c-di-GMP-specific phosphodiesterase class I)